MMDFERLVPRRVRRIEWADAAAADPHLKRASERQCKVRQSVNVKCVRAWMYSASERQLGCCDVFVGCWGPLVGKRS